MVKLKYVGISNSITSRGKKFIKGAVFEVTEEVYIYLTSTFGKSFEIIEEVVKEPIVEKKTRKRKPTVKVEK